MDLLCPNEHIVTHTHAINHDMITFLQSLAYFIFRNTVIHRQGSDHKPGAHYKNCSLACMLYTHREWSNERDSVHRTKLPNTLINILYYTRYKCLYITSYIIFMCYNVDRRCSTVTKYMIKEETRYI